MAGNAWTSANHIGWVINRLDLYNVVGNWIARELPSELNVHYHKLDTILIKTLASSSKPTHTPSYYICTCMNTPDKGSLLLPVICDCDIGFESLVRDSVHP